MTGKKKKTDSVKISKSKCKKHRSSSSVRKQSSFTYTGTFSASIAGFGFVKPDIPELPEFFIPGRYTCRAIDGDKVRFKELSGELNTGNGNNTNPVGEIVEVLCHTRQTVMAELSSRNRATPMDKHLPESIAVKSVPRNIRNGAWVKLKLLQEEELPAKAGHKKRVRPLMGEVVDSCGTAGLLSADLDAVCQEFDLPEPYTEKENLEAQKLQPREIDREDHNYRQAY